MVWTSPMTAVANEIWTAAQYNTYVRDNLLETAPAKATTGNIGAVFFNDTGNHIVERPFVTNYLTTSESTTSTSYTALATVVETSRILTSGAIILLGSRVVNYTSGQQSFVSVRVIDSGSTEVVAPADTKALGHTGTSVVRGQSPPIAVTLSAGTYTFQMRHRVTGGTGTFADRWIAVIPL